MSARNSPTSPHTSAPKLNARWSEHGQGMTEYAFILVLIAVVVIVALVLVGGQLVNVFQNVAAAI
ncbi:MAG: Flp family type IVb pilin [Candidatus Dormibacteria bacterium]